MSDFRCQGGKGGRRCRSWLRGACFCVALGWSHAAFAQSDLVRVTCPQLTREQAAEIEARVRASLLTTDESVSVAIDCEGETASVKIQVSSERFALETLPLGANLREELLGAPDRAFRKLAQSSASSDELTPPLEPTAEATAEPSPAVAPPLADPPAAPPAVRPDRPASLHTNRTGAFTRAASEPLFAQGVAERWSSRLAWGVELGSEWAVGSVRLGARAAVLVPVASSPTYTLRDWLATVQAAVHPRALAGIQLTMGLGWGWMVVSPRGAASSHAVSVVQAPFVLLALSRAIRWRAWALVPELGARVFASERGVRVDGRESLSFGWLAPRLALGIAYISD